MNPVYFIVSVSDLHVSGRVLLYLGLLPGRFRSSSRGSRASRTCWSWTTSRCRGTWPSGRTSRWREPSSSSPTTGTASIFPPERCWRTRSSPETCGSSTTDAFWGNKKKRQPAKQKQVKVLEDSLTGQRSEVNLLIGTRGDSLTTPDFLIISNSRFRDFLVFKVFKWSSVGFQNKSPERRLDMMLSHAE